MGYLASVQKTHPNIHQSPWEDCGYTYRGNAQKTKSGIKCQSWESDFPHQPSFDVANRGNFCTLKDMRGVQFRLLNDFLNTILNIHLNLF